MSVDTPAVPSKKFVQINPKVTRRVKLIDNLANILIQFGGIGVILVVILILVFIGKEALPLFLPGSAEPLVKSEIKTLAAPNTPLVMGVDEYQTFAYFVEHDSAQVDFYDMLKGEMVSTVPFAKLTGKKISCAYRTPSFDYLFIGTGDGHVLLSRVIFDADLSTGVRVVKPELKEYGLIKIPGTSGPIQKVFGRVSAEGEMVFAAVTAEQKVYFGKMTLDAVELMDQNQGLVEGTAASEEGRDQTDEEKAATLVEYTFSGEIKHIAIDRLAERLFVVDGKGSLYQFYLEESLSIPFAIYQDFKSESGVDRQITAMDLLIGDVTLLLGFNDGTTEGWFGVREKEGDSLRKIRPIHRFESLGASITTIIPSARNKAFVAGADNGRLALNFTTSEQRLLNLSIQGSVALAAYAPKLTQILGFSSNGSFESFEVHVPHPEISLKTLFGKVWYEGYDKPDFSWQSSGGSDDFEPKLSLTPLLVGTLKGAFYGLLFAIPIAVMAALYTSQFLNPAVKTYVKPTIEIMAALPSVVIGFLAGLWLAPLLENKLVMIFLCSIFIPIGAVLAALLWNKVPVRMKLGLPPGIDLIILIVTTLIAGYLSYQIGFYVDLIFFGGDIRQWIYNAIGQQVEQRNSIVIGLAMGFAVIPIIFTISEDAFSNVPRSFTSASYALGASPWQTAFRIILPTASPGVFSAVMIGFGRAVGETMIVLMATGNTPIMSFSPFNGMRTLSANIAVEIPEAPVGETHYRVLFLAAMLLFVLTFSVNTVAEIVRQHLREKYKAV